MVASAKLPTLVTAQISTPKPISAKAQETEKQPTLTETILQKVKNSFAAASSYVRQNPYRTLIGAAGVVAASYGAYIGYTWLRADTLKNSSSLSFREAAEAATGQCEAPLECEAPLQCEAPLECEIPVDYSATNRSMGTNQIRGNSSLTDPSQNVYAPSLVANRPLAATQTSSLGANIPLAATAGGLSLTAAVIAARKQVGNIANAVLQIGRSALEKLSLLEAPARTISGKIVSGIRKRKRAITPLTLLKIVGGGTALGVTQLFYQYFNLGNTAKTAQPQPRDNRNSPSAPNLTAQKDLKKAIQPSVQNPVVSNIPSQRNSAAPVAPKASPQQNASEPVAPKVPLQPETPWNTSAPVRNPLLICPAPVVLPPQPETPWNTSAPIRNPLPICPAPVVLPPQPETPWNTSAPTANCPAPKVAEQPRTDSKAVVKHTNPLRSPHFSISLSDLLKKLSLNSEKRVSSHLAATAGRYSRV